jgi:hypothetical protein
LVTNIKLNFVLWYRVRFPDEDERHILSRRPRPQHVVCDETKFEHPGYIQKYKVPQVVGDRNNTAGGCNKPPLHRFYIYKRKSTYMYQPSKCTCTALAIVKVASILIMRTRVTSRLENIDCIWLSVNNNNNNIICVFLILI